MPRAADSAYQMLRERILAGDLPSGSHLGEVDVAATLGLSRTPVREALQRLSSEGLVEVLPHRGARVVEWTPAQLAEIFELRALLEPYGAARAATRGVPDDLLADLDRLCELMETAAAAGDLDTVADYNTRFHGLVLEASGNSRLTDMVRSVVHVPVVVGTFHRYDADNLARSMNHHRELVAAMRARDPEWAAAVLRSHIRAAADVIIAQLAAERARPEGAAR